MGSDDGNKTKQHDNNLVNILYTNYTKCISCFRSVTSSLSTYNYYQWLYRYIQTNISTITNPNNAITLSTRIRRDKYRSTKVVGVYITLGVFCFIVVMFLVIIPLITTILVNHHHYNWYQNKLLLYISPEYYVTDTFTRNLYNENDYKVLPSHCQLLAKQFDYCQQQSSTLYNNNEGIVTTTTTRTKKQQSFIKPTIVYGCHRRWCHSLFGGHCEPCSGLGDRFRFLISQINTLYNTNTNTNHNNNHNNNIHQSIDDITCNAYIQIDSPIIGLQQLRSTLYIDYNSWWNEFVHERSYDVSQRHVLSYQQIIQSHHQQQQQVENYGTNNNNHDIYYTHFTPNQYGITNDYNACFFHILYQPDYTLQNDIKYHWNAILSNGLKINNNNNNNIIQQQSEQKSYHRMAEEEEVDEEENIYTTIGIHYRTGDALAFNIHNLDERVHENQLLIGWKKLYNCTISLMKQIIIHSTNNQNHNDNINDNNSNTNSIYKNVRFYLATDNPTVKDYVRQNYAYNNSNVNYESSSSSSISIPVYVTDIQPFSYLRGNVGDRTALLELYLLSKCNGIVVNTLPSEGYNGTAHTVSQFAMFAKKIGFIPNTNFYQCSLD